MFDEKEAINLHPKYSKMSVNHYQSTDTLPFPRKNAPILMIYFSDR
jgi:hypothetical protein